MVRLVVHCKREKCDIYIVRAGASDQIAASGRGAEYIPEGHLSLAKSFRLEKNSDPGHLKF